MGGKAYVITDSEPENVHAFLLPLVEHALGSQNVRAMPRALAMPLAWATELTYTVLGRWLKAQPNLTRYSVCTLSGDLWFTHERATRDFGYQPRVDLQEARARTCAWLDDVTSRAATEVS